MWRITEGGKVTSDGHDTEEDALEAAEQSGQAVWEKGGTDHNPHRGMYVLSPHVDIEEYDDPDYDPTDEEMEAMNPFSEERFARACAERQRFLEAWRLKR